MNMRRALATVVGGCLAALLLPMTAAAPASAVSIAPAAVQSALLYASDGFNRDEFGRAVAVSSGTAVVGAPLDDEGDGGADVNQGAAYVFVRDAGGWSQEAKLVAPDAAAGDQFGASVAVSGGTVVVGAPEAGGGTGAAYVFVRTSEGWVFQQRITDPALVPSDRLGASSAVDGDTALVSSAGGAFVFTRSDGVWSRQDRLAPAGGLALAADTALLGDPKADSSTGVVRVYTRLNGVWTLAQELRASDATGLSSFGDSLAMSGDIALIGAPNDDALGHDAGKAYVFTRSGGVWSERQKLRSPDPAGSQQFGTSVALSASIGLVGVPAQTALNSFEGAGVVHVYRVAGGVLTWRDELTLTDPHEGDGLGRQVAISGATIVAGVPSRTRAALGAATGGAGVFQLLPFRPVARSPKGAIGALRPTFRWQRATFATSYEVRVYRGASLLRHKTGVTRLSWRPLKPLPRGVYLTWKVRGQNAAGTGVCSAALRFRIG